MTKPKLSWEFTIVDKIVVKRCQMLTKPELNWELAK